MHGAGGRKPTASWRGHQRGRRALRALRRPAVASVLAAAVACASFENNEGLRRSLAFNWKMVPLALEYRARQWLLQYADEAERASAVQQFQAECAVAAAAGRGRAGWGAGTSPGGSGRWLCT